MAGSGFEVALAVADGRWFTVWDGAFEFISLAYAIGDGGARISEWVRDLCGDGSCRGEQGELGIKLRDPDGVSTEIVVEISLMSKGVVECERFFVLSNAL